MQCDVLQRIDTEMAMAAENMAFDEALLEALDPQGIPILHFYRWKSPAATYGYFIDPARHLDLAKSALHGVDLARRPTGGGIVFHFGDLAFSFLMPSRHPACLRSPLANYRFVNEVVLEAVSALFPEKGELAMESPPHDPDEWHHFCMARATRYDVMFQGEKMAGSAQRARQQGYLHQGTISLTLPPLPLLQEILLPHTGVLEAMTQRSFTPVKEPSQLEEVRGQLETLLEEKFVAKLRAIA